MKAAIVRQAGTTPVYGDFADPVPADGDVRIAVTASALSPLVKGRAAGTHYSANNAFPFIAGVDGVGRREDGQRVYFILPSAPYGSMAETAVVPASHCVAVPGALDDVAAAALANPGMSSWAALTERARFKSGDAVLINGATGAAGSLAVQIARHLGARRIIATGRNPKILQSLGADATIPLVEDRAALEAAFREHFARGIDVVLDYLWGPSAECFLAAAAKSGRPAAPVRIVQIGSASGANIALPGALLRSAAIELMGSGIGSVSLPRLLAAIGEMLLAAGPAKFAIATRSLPLVQVDDAWGKDTGVPRLVFTIGRSGL
ncbi:MAG TPA: zinc-binding alcohol dehydrogenase family protein [Rhizomicrobium sp.]|jgi:NADPH:quinone reductase-like Zn-dependent oxidoreductase